MTVTSHASLSQEKTKYEFTDTRISQADTLLKHRQYEEALAAYETAYNSYEQESFYEGMVYAKERMGSVYRDNGEDGLSQISYLKASDLSRKKLGHNHILETKVVLNNSKRHYLNGDFQSASESVDIAWAKYRRSNQYDSTLFKGLIDY